MSTLRDVFIQHHDDRYFLYAPLKELVVEVDRTTAGGLSDLLRGQCVDDFAGKEQWSAFLQEIATPISNSHSIGGLRTEQLIDHAPAATILSLTKECNLRCVYCYIHGGEESGSMDFDIAKAAIEFVASNARKKNLSSFGVSFHGEGEPTFRWSLFKDATLYAEEVARTTSLKSALFLTSNGMWSAKQYDFIVSHFDGFSISMDGLAEVQNSQRPTKSGASSFSIVRDNLRRLRADGISCSVRMTVMEEHVNEIRPFLTFLHDETLVRDLQVEPIFSSGRGAGYAADNSRFQASFAKQFMEARKLGQDFGVAVTYSGCSTPRFDGSFCGATGQEPNFVVMSGGLVSSCYEVSKETHKLGEFFIYGHYNRSLKAFEFSQDRLRRLMQYGASEDSPCRSCFAQRNCFGDCLTRRDLDQLISGSGSSSRCSLNQDVLSRTIAQQVDDRTREPSH